ncbi:MAG: YybH family protein [Candidatus Acidiferrales bacterium]
MRRTFAFVTIAFLAGLGVGYFARSAGLGTLLQSEKRAADLAAIEKLHQEDIEATLSQDPKGLMDIWAEDAVRFNPGNPPAVGKQAIRAENEKARALYPGLKILSYTAKYKNIQIEDGLACEWGEHEAQFKLSPEAPPASWQSSGFHILRRQSDGSWKFATIITSQ